MTLSNKKWRIWETNYGRESGWYVFLGETKIAVLSDCRWEEMFWDSYVITPHNAEVIDGVSIFCDEFWNSNLSRLKYKNIELGDFADFSFPAACPLVENNRIMMRDLYLCFRAPNYFERLLMWFNQKSKHNERN